jgi:2-C-methyl-D-erythritol 2,4-cyclodiphosphate synthase
MPGGKQAARVWREWHGLVADETPPSGRRHCRRRGVRRMTLTGIGYDSHRLIEGRPLILGGVEIPGELGLDGHSDADVLTHAVIDALLGAAGLGDIGEHFPDSDERYRDADSIELLETVLPRVLAQGLELVNVDSTVVMEHPKLGPYREAIRTRLAGALGLAPGRVNVKATTGEGIGFVGRGEGVAALAVVGLDFAD